MAASIGCQPRIGWSGWATSCSWAASLSPLGRIQSDRGHQVVDSGPYAIIRHPGYVAGILLAGGYPLSLGSLWALIPAAAFQAPLAYRTLKEEEVLRSELPGYVAYAEHAGGTCGRLR